MRASAEAATGIELETSANGPVYGKLGDALRTIDGWNTVEIGIVEGPQDVVKLEYEGSSIRLETLAAARSVSLSMTTARVLGGFLVPRRVRVVRASRAGLDVEPRLDVTVEPLVANLFRHVECKDLTLGTTLDAKAALPQPKGVGERAALAGDDPVELATEPDGPPVARLHPLASKRTVTVLDTRGKRRQIAFDTGDAVAFGWVDGKRLEPAGHVDRPVRPSDTRAERPQVRGVRCAGEVTLFFGSRRIGAVRANVPIWTLAKETGERVPIVEPLGGNLLSGSPPEIVMAEGAALEVETRSIARCPAP